jgi:hypothetical protein
MHILVPGVIQGMTTCHRLFAAESSGMSDARGCLPRRYGPPRERADLSARKICIEVMCLLCNVTGKVGSSARKQASGYTCVQSRL